jgi:integrase
MAAFSVDHMVNLVRDHSELRAAILSSARFGILCCPD